MPKRDDAYMERQRELIARAALEVLLEKGLHDASLREICAQADVSVGAFYNHFPTKTDAIVAARVIDVAEVSAVPPAKNWAEYVAFVGETFCSRDPQRLRRRRLSLQFAAELLNMTENPKGLSEIYEVQRRQMRDSLSAVHQAGEVTLPLGLDQTVEVHAMLALGASYRVSNDVDLSIEEALATLTSGLRSTAGFKSTKVRG